MYKRTGRRSYLVLSQLIVAVFLVTGAAQASNVGAHFVHYATVENAYGGSTQIRHPLTDDRPDAIVHVTQNLNPPGASGTYNDKVIGVIYYNGQWSIFNEDDSAIPVGASFNVWVPKIGIGPTSFVHTATAGSVSGNWTLFNSLLTNDNVDAHVIVTPNYNPGGGGGYYNNSVTGVFYNFDQEKWGIFNQDGASMPIGASFNVTVLFAGPSTETHAANSANIEDHWTVIDHPLANNNPNAIVSVTQNPSAYPFGGVYNDHPIGIFYTGSRWAIFNQDLAAMPVHAFFNVSVPSTESALFVHEADVVNTSAWSTYVDQPASNDNPHAMLFVTQNWNPGGAGGLFNDHPIGVWYSDGLSRWTVVNQDSATIPIGASFNVSIPAVGASTFVHTATDGNTTLNWTWFDNPVTNGNPDAIVHVTQSRNPSGIGGVTNDHHVGVWYDGSRWAVFNQDLASVPEGASFNVSIPAVDDATFVHTATVGSISGNSTVFQHPYSDGNPNAIVRVTQNWNPGDSGEVYNDHAIGVWYTGNEWSIFNQDDSAMPEGASFNVTVGGPLFSDGFETGNTSAWSAAVP